MSHSFTAAFHTIIALQGRDTLIERDAGATTATIKVANSSYFRNFGGIEETTIEGKEFVVSQRELTDKGFPKPQRGDLLVDTIMGNNSITEVVELIILGRLVGYRLRTA